MKNIEIFVIILKPFGNTLLREIDLEDKKVESPEIASIITEMNMDRARATILGTCEFLLHRMEYEKAKNPQIAALHRRIALEGWKLRQESARHSLWDDLVLIVPGSLSYTKCREILAKDKFGQVLKAIESLDSGGQ